MAQFNGTVIDRTTAENFLRNRQSKKLANNTYVHIWGDEITVTLHGNVIATYQSDGITVLSNCGYPTMTTRQRLSELNPFYHFVQRDHEQYMQHKKTRELVPFIRTVKLDSYGNVLKNEIA